MGSAVATQSASGALLEVTRGGSGHSRLGLHADTSASGRLGQSQCPCNRQLCSGRPIPPAPGALAPHSRRLCALPLGTLHAHTTAPGADGPGAPARPATVHGLGPEAHGNALPIQTPLPRQTEVEQAHSKLLTLVRTRWVEGLERPRGEGPKGWGRPPSSRPTPGPHGGAEQGIK